MKFKLEIEAGVKRIILTPEDQGEQLILGTIVDPNQISTPASDPARSAEVTAKVSNDRIPFRKVTHLLVEFS